jgi:hypothetical protein
MISAGDFARLQALIERSRQLKDQAARLLTAASKLDETIHDEFAMFRDSEDRPLARRGCDLFPWLPSDEHAAKAGLRHHGNGDR